jgi:hypothetical protein
MKHTRVVRSLANAFGSKLKLSFIVASALASVFGACQGVGVGDPCIPEDEYRTGFGGYSKDEVNVESRSFQCETRVCLVNKFQGRVSCPYGQEDPNAPDGCKTPDEADTITVPVLCTVRVVVIRRQARRVATHPTASAPRASRAKT